MRALDKKEMAKRGCECCKDIAKDYFPEMPNPTFRKWACPHEECPYDELDDFDSYSQYLKSLGPNSLKQVLLDMFDIKKEI